MFAGARQTTKTVIMPIIRFYRSAKKALFPRTRMGYERFKQFLLLPGLFHKVRSIKDFRRSRWGLATDFLAWFFSYKTLPVHYGLSRLWEVERSEWKYYYGSNYQIPQLAQLKKSVQPPEYRIIFNDKYVCALLCRAMGIRIPTTHGILDPAQDYRSRIADWLGSSSAGRLIIKPLFGEMGRDIVMAETSEQGIVVRSPNGHAPLSDFVLKEKALAQDVVSQDPRLAAFSPNSVNTLRIVTMSTHRDGILIVNASFRSGVAKAFVDNWSAGGVSVGVDCDRGILKKYAYDKQSNRYARHPTSGIVFEGHPVPAWNLICAAAVRIQQSFSFYRLIGLDLALDADGAPVLIEANGAPDLAGLEQKVGPLLKRESVLRAFGDDGLLFNRHQIKAYKELVGKDSVNGPPFYRTRR
jgi:hypothetical protein